MTLSKNWAGAFKLISHRLKFCFVTPKKFTEYLSNFEAIKFI